MIYKIKKGDNEYEIKKLIATSIFIANALNPPFSL